MASNIETQPVARTIKDRINAYLSWLSLSDHIAYNCILYSYIYTGFDIIQNVEEWEKGLHERVAIRKIERAQKVAKRMKNKG
jgi:hypothetical protein